MSEPTKPSIAEIQAAYNRVTSSSESVGIDDDVSADAQMVDAAIDELATLRDQLPSLDEWRNRAKEQRLRAEAAETELVALRVRYDELHAEHRAVLNRCVAEVRRIADERDMALAWRAKAEPALLDFLNDHRDEDGDCLFCQQPRRVAHKDDCSVTIATALLGDGGQG